MWEWPGDEANIHSQPVFYDELGRHRCQIHNKGASWTFELQRGRERERKKERESEWGRGKEKAVGEKRWGGFYGWKDGSVSSKPHSRDSSPHSCGGHTGHMTDTCTNLRTGTVWPPCTNIR